MNAPPPHFVLRWETAEAGHPERGSANKTELWSVWRGPERVGELEGEWDIGSARVVLWGCMKDIGTWGGESPADKFQKWIVSPGVDEWIEGARQRGLRES